MHRFSLLVEGCVAFTLSCIKDASSHINSHLKNSGSTLHVKRLQALSLQRAVTAVGLFSMFEAHLQRQLQAHNGFKQAYKILIENNDQILARKFKDFILAVNVLKHGQGRSYNELLDREDQLTFRIKSQNTPFFDEGNVSEIDCLILADDEFVLQCAKIISEVSSALYDLDHSYTL